MTHYTLYIDNSWTKVIAMTPLPGPSLSRSKLELLSSRIPGIYQQSFTQGTTRGAYNQPIFIKPLTWAVWFMAYRSLFTIVVWQSNHLFRRQRREPVRYSASDILLLFSFLSYFCFMLAVSSFLCAFQFWTNDYFFLFLWLSFYLVNCVSEIGNR